MQVRTEVEIAAPPESVWEVLVDFARYPEWNPFMVKIDGSPKEGAQLNVLMALPDGSEHRVRPTLLKVVPARELRWVGRVGADFLLRAEHSFELSSNDGGHTILHHNEDFRGVLVKLITRTLVHTARAFVGMNEALKKRVEQS